MERKEQEQLAKEAIPDILFRLVDFMQGREEWTGTATELLDALGETGTAANVLTKWMNEYRLDFLLENHIRYDFSRRSSGRMISLARQEDVGDDGYNRHDRHAPETGSDSYPPKKRKMMNYALCNPAFPETPNRRRCGL